ncbi:MAG: virulence RhuM family protein [Bacilli bacterium]|nr:virulence RhuM family protein [Bacilli bacterium]
MQNCEIVKFNNGDFELDVNVSLEEETVWLSLNELCTLFGRDKSVISRHIQRIFADGECDKKQVVAKNATTGSDGKTYHVTYYNLDLIISLGYRVHSINGITFRKWANRVLKDYLIKGYVVNPKKVEITIDDWNKLNTEVKYVTHQIELLKNDLLRKPLKDELFFEGQFFDAFCYIVELLSQANKSVIIIDPYFDTSVLHYLSHIKKNVRIDVFTGFKRMISEPDTILFSKQHPNFNIFITTAFHDRFIIIDKEKCYGIGSSLNSLGSKTFSVHQTNEPEQITVLLDKVNKLK